MNDVESIQYFLVDVLGWKEGKIRITKGSKRPTVESFSREHPNIYAVLSVAHHITAVVKEIMLTHGIVVIAQCINTGT